MALLVVRDLLCNSLLNRGLLGIRVNLARLRDAANVRALHALLAGPEVARGPEVVAILTLGAEAQVGEAAELEGQELRRILVSDLRRRRHNLCCGCNRRIRLLGLLGGLLGLGLLSSRRDRGVALAGLLGCGLLCVLLGLRSLATSLQLREVLRRENLLGLCGLLLGDGGAVANGGILRGRLNRVLGVGLLPLCLKRLVLLGVILLVIPDELHVGTLHFRVGLLELLDVLGMLLLNLAGEVTVDGGLTRALGLLLLALGLLARADGGAAGLERQLRINLAALGEEVGDGEGAVINGHL